MILAVDAATRRNQEQPDAKTRTLGDLLYANKANCSVSEKDWFRLVQLIAAGDQLALHSLYEQTHRIVFTLIVRITNSRETAEELTIDVFYDVYCGLKIEKRELTIIWRIHVSRLQQMTRSRPARLRSRTGSCKMPWRFSRRKSGR